MRQVDYSKSFKRDLKRELKGRYRNILGKGGEYYRIVMFLANNIPLPPRYRDHILRHNMEGKRECHIRPDFLLVYMYVGDDWLILDRLGSHAEIFGM